MDTLTVTAQASATAPDIIHEVICVGDYIFGCIRGDRFLESSMPAPVDQQPQAFIRVHVDTYEKQIVQAPVASPANTYVYTRFSGLVHVPQTGKIYALGASTRPPYTSGGYTVNDCALIEVSGADGGPVTAVEKILFPAVRIKCAQSRGAIIPGSIVYDGSRYLYGTIDATIFKIDTTNWTYSAPSAALSGYANQYRYSHSLSYDGTHLWIGMECAYRGDNSGYAQLVKVRASDLGWVAGANIPPFTGPGPNTSDSQYVYGATECATDNYLSGQDFAAMVWALDKTTLTFKRADAPYQKSSGWIFGAKTAGMYLWNSTLVVFNPQYADYYTGPTNLPTLNPAWPAQIVFVPTNTVGSWVTGGSGTTGYKPYTDVASKKFLINLPQSFLDAGLSHVNDGAVDSRGRWHVSCFDVQASASGAGLVRLPALGLVIPVTYPDGPEGTRWEATVGGLVPGRNTITASSASDGQSASVSVYDGVTISAGTVANNAVTVSGFGAPTSVTAPGATVGPISYPDSTSWQATISDLPTGTTTITASDGTDEASTTIEIVSVDATAASGTGSAADLGFDVSQGLPLRDSATRKWCPIRYRPSGKTAFLRRS